MKLTNKDKILLHRLLTILCLSFGIGLIFLIWYVIAITLNNALIPTPKEVLGLYFSYYADPILYISIGWTLLRLLFSFLLSFVISFVLGVIASEFYYVKIILKPIVLVLKTIPTAAIILILIVLLKPFMALFIIVFLVMFPILYEAIINGYENIDKNVINSLKVDSSKHSLKAIFKIKVPLIFPYIILGIFQTIGLGMKVSLMAEVLVGNNKVLGLGILIRQAYNFAYVDQILAYSIHAIILIALVDIIIYIIKKNFKNKYSIQ